MLDSSLNLYSLLRWAVIHFKPFDERSELNTGILAGEQPAVDTLERFHIFHVGSFDLLFNTDRKSPYLIR